MFECILLLSMKPKVSRPNPKNIKAILKEMTAFLGKEFITI